MTKRSVKKKTDLRDFTIQRVYPSGKKSSEPITIDLADLMNDEGDQYNKAVVLSTLSLSFSLNSEPGEAEKCVRAALQKARAIGYTELEAYQLYRMGEFCQSRKEDSRALAWYFEALSIARAIKKYSLMCELYLLMGKLNGKMQNYISGLKYLDQSERLATKHNIRIYISQILEAKGDIYRAIGDVDRAQELYNRSYDNDKEYRDKTEELENAVRLDSLNLEGGESTKTASYYRQLIRRAKGEGNESAVLTNTFELGLHFIREKKYLRAHNCFSRVLKSVSKDYANNLSIVRSTLFQTAFLLRKLDRGAIASRIELFENRLKALDNESTYTPPQRNSLRAEIVRELPDLVQDIVDMRIGHYEASGVRVNLESGEIFIANESQREKLSHSERVVFRFLFENIGRNCEVRAIHDAYSGADIYPEAIEARVRTMIRAIRRKGIPKTLLQVVPKKGYKLVRG